MDVRKRVASYIRDGPCAHRCLTAKTLTCVYRTPWRSAVYCMHSEHIICHDPSVIEGKEPTEQELETVMARSSRDLSGVRDPYASLPLAFYAFEVTGHDDSKADDEGNKLIKLTLNVIGKVDPETLKLTGEGKGANVTHFASDSERRAPFVKGMLEGLGQPLTGWDSTDWLHLRGVAEMGPQRNDERYTEVKRFIEHSKWREVAGASGVEVSGRVQATLTATPAAAPAAQPAAAKKRLF